MPPIITFAAGILIAYLGGLLLIDGRSLLAPIVIALLIWHLLNSVHSAIRLWPKIGKRLPYWLSFTLTFIVFCLLIEILYSIISNNVTNVIQASARYQANVQSILMHMNQSIPFKVNVQLDSVLRDWNLQTVLVGIYGMFTAITSSAVLIGLYVVFLFVEQHFFTNKLNALFPQAKYRAIVESILKHIVQDTQTYLGVKTFLSLITAFASWLVMRFVGLDFAAFWALLIFFLNFIPNIGAIIASVLPIVLATIQFQRLMPCVILAGGIIVIQFIVGNLIEPRFLSKSLNMSTLVILIALAFWGTVWGVLGMFLSVPITVMMMIIFAHFEGTRPIALLLSRDGCIQKTYEKI